VATLQATHIDYICCGIEFERIPSVSIRAVTCVLVCWRPGVSFGQRKPTG
jgi:hypothetical protein